MGAPHKIAIVVPTIGRCAELRRMLTSVAAQTRLPDQVLIVGEGEGSAEIARQCPQLRAEFIPMPGSSICDARNRGAREARRDADLIAFMDDDIVLESGAIGALLQFWETAPGDLGGTGCRLSNHPEIFARRLKSLPLASRLGLYDARQGAVLRSGIHTMMPDVAATTWVQWLPTYAVVYPRKVLAEFSFDDWFENYSYLEDLDLSYRIGKKYRLAIVAEARFHHYPSNVGRPDAYRFGKKEVLNRLHIVSKHAELSLSLCSLALSIRAAMNLILGVSRREGDYFRRFAGNVAGALDALGQAMRNRAQAALRACAGAARVPPRNRAPKAETMKPRAGKRRASGPARVLVCAYACVTDPGSRLPGGGDLMAWNVVTRMSRHFEVWVLTSALNRPAIENALRSQPCPDLHFCYVGLPGFLRWVARLPGGVQLAAYIWQWRAYFTARRLHAQIGFHGFHHLTYENDWMASPTGALLPVPYLRGPGGGAHRTPAGFIRRYRLRGRVWEKVRAAGQWIFRHDPFFILGQSRAKALLVCNREALEAIPRKWRRKARLFPVNGVSAEAFQAEESRLDESAGFRIVTAGRLVRLKGFDLAIRAFAQFVERNQAAASATQVSLSIIGEGPERERLETLAFRLGVGDRVQFAGWQTRARLWDRMHASDVFLFPSLRDGGGAVVVEAMAAGKPIVCVDLGGPGVHVTAECGVKVKPMTPAQVSGELASALETLYRHPEIRRQMGRAASRRARKLYLWDVFAERLLHIYEDVLGPEAEGHAASPFPPASHAERLPGHAL